jgi:uncharacterized protein (DUF1697 family)
VRQIVLLRGVNVGGRNKLAMPALREALEGANMREVSTAATSCSTPSIRRTSSSGAAKR